MGMELQDYAAMQELQKQDKDGRWGTNTALWIIAAVIVIAFIANIWAKNCTEKVAFATGLSDLHGRIECIQPQVGKLNDQMYGAAQAFAGLTVGLSETRRDFGTQLGQLNNTVYYNPANEGWFGYGGGCGRNRGGGCGCGTPNRVFAQTQTYTPSTSEVTVTETCGNDRC